MHTPFPHKLRNNACTLYRIRIRFYLQILSTIVSLIYNGLLYILKGGTALVTKCNDTPRNEKIFCFRDSTPYLFVPIVHERHSLTDGNKIFIHTGSKLTAGFIPPSYYKFDRIQSLFVDLDFIRKLTLIIYYTSVNWFNFRTVSIDQRPSAIASHGWSVNCDGENFFSSDGIRNRSCINLFA